MSKEQFEKYLEETQKELGEAKVREKLELFNEIEKILKRVEKLST